MANIVNNCPRCGAKKITFDIKGVNFIGEMPHTPTQKSKYYEVYSVCKECVNSTIFVARLQDSRIDLTKINWSNADYNLSNFVTILRAVSPADLEVSNPPEFLPDNINDVFMEGSKCLSIGCFNAAATMYRLCLDMATKDMLPKESDEPAAKIRRSLGLRMNWLFNNGRLPAALKELAECVKDDGNDGAHDGLMDEITATDLKEFTYILLERLYTENERLKVARERREQRHNKSGS